MNIGIKNTSSHISAMLSRIVENNTLFIVSGINKDLNCKINFGVGIYKVGFDRNCPGDQTNKNIGNMKSKHLLYAIPMLAMGFASCSNEEIKPQSIMTGETIKTSLAINVPLEGYTTRQTAQTTQNGSFTYRGMQDLYLFPLTTAPEIAQKYFVMSIPTLKFIDNGELKGSFVGAMAPDELEEWVDERL